MQEDKTVFKMPKSIYLEATFLMVNKNGRSKICFYWYCGLSHETILKLVYALFTMLVKNGINGEY